MWTDLLAAEVTEANECGAQRGVAGDERPGQPSSSCG